MQQKPCWLQMQRRHSEVHWDAAKRAVPHWIAHRVVSTIANAAKKRQCETFTVPQATSTVWQLGVSSAPEKPRRVLVESQTDKSGSHLRNAVIFYHCSLTNMQVWLNHSRYPSLDMTTDFAKEQFWVYTSRFTILLAGTMGR